MRGEDTQQSELFSYGSLEERVPAGHPLRPIRTMVDEALKEMNGRFEEIYGTEGRPSIAPERLLRALLLQLLYSVRSERMLMEQLEYNLLFRWFVGLSANEPVWHPTVFTKNRDRLLLGAVAEEFFSLIVRQARSRKLLSDEHFTVDGTLIEAWAGQKSFQRKDHGHDPLNPPPADRGSNPTVNWHKEKRTNETHESLTDPMARLYKKSRGAEARLGYLGHVLTENRNGLVVDVRPAARMGRIQLLVGLKLSMNIEENLLMIAQTLFPDSCQISFQLRRAVSQHSEAFRSIAGSRMSRRTSPEMMSAMLGSAVSPVGDRRLGPRPSLRDAVHQFREGRMGVADHIGANALDERE